MMFILGALLYILGVVICDYTARLAANMGSAMVLSGSVLMLAAAVMFLLH